MSMSLLCSSESQQVPSSFLYLLLLPWTTSASEILSSVAILPWLLVDAAATTDFTRAPLPLGLKDDSKTQAVNCHDPLPPASAARRRCCAGAAATWGSLYTCSSPMVFTDATATTEFK